MNTNPDILKPYSHSLAQASDYSLNSSLTKVDITPLNGSSNDSTSSGPSRPSKERTVLVLREFMNDLRHIDKHLSQYNKELNPGDLIAGTAKTIHFFKKKYIKNKFTGKLIYFHLVLFHRIFPKLNKAFQSIYFSITKGKGQHLSKTEIIGRLNRNGFDIKSILLDEEGELSFYAEKKREYDHTRKPSYWPIFHMRRTGKNGKLIFVYKLRTMHPYAEFVQEYITQQHGLEKTGKFMNDFRITSWGKVLRRCWLDEVPMIINLIKGDIKLVGVRPLSEGYLKLYPEEFRKFRNQFKPGLIPPFYADMPQNFDAIIESEKKYLLAYQKRHFRTDINYLFAILKNIFFKKARSK